jgi:hypothetical protein
MAEVGKFHRRMQDLMDHPERWHAVDLDTLKQLTFFQCLLFGGTGEIDRAREMGRRYAVLTERPGEGDRLQLLDYVTRSVETRVGTVDSLMPFIFRDPEVRVVAAASIELAVLMPLKDGDPMTGPKTLRRMSDNARDETALLGLLAGLLLLGDRRTLPLLEGCWERLGRSAGGYLGPQRTTESGRRREDVSLQRARRFSPDPGNRGMDLSRVWRTDRTPTNRADEEGSRADGHPESPLVVEQSPGVA